MRLRLTAAPTSGGPSADESGHDVQHRHGRADGEHPERHDDDRLVHVRGRDELTQREETEEERRGEDVRRHEDPADHHPRQEGAHRRKDTPLRPEQINRLVAIEEELVDVYIEECQPKKWPDTSNAQNRGDRYWFKKNALATLTLVGRIQTVLRDARGDGSGAGEQKDPPPGQLDPAEDIEQEAARLEKQGVALLRKHAKGKG